MVMKNQRTYFLLFKQGLKGIFKFKVQFIIIIILTFLATFILTTSLTITNRLKDSHNNVVGRIEPFDYSSTVATDISASPDAKDPLRYVALNDFINTDFTRIINLDKTLSSQFNFNLNASNGQETFLTKLFANDEIYTIATRQENTETKRSEVAYLATKYLVNDLSLYVSNSEAEGFLIEIEAIFSDKTPDTKKIKDLPKVTAKEIDANDTFYYLSLVGMSISECSDDGAVQKPGDVQTNGLLGMVNPISINVQKISEDKYKITSTVNPQQTLDSILQKHYNQLLQLHILMIRIFLIQIHLNITDKEYLNLVNQSGISAADMVAYSNPIMPMYRYHLKMIGDITHIDVNLRREIISFDNISQTTYRQVVINDEDYSNLTILNERDGGRMPMSFGEILINEQFSLTLASSGIRNISLLTVVITIASFLISMSIIIPTVAYDTGTTDEGRTYEYYENPMGYSSSSNGVSPLPTYLYNDGLENTYNYLSADSESSPENSDLFAMILEIFGSNFINNVGTQFSIGMIEQIFGVVANSIQEDGNGEILTDQQKLEKYDEITASITAVIPQIIGLIAGSSGSAPPDLTSAVSFVATSNAGVNLIVNSDPISTEGGIGDSEARMMIDSQEDIMAKIAVVLHNGFEEIEAITIIDVLRRASIDISVNADKLSKDLDIKNFDGIAIPGGPGIEALLKSNDEIIKFIKDFNNDKKLVAAICAAPQLLGKAEVVNNKKITGFPNAIKYLDVNNINNNIGAITDQNIITGASAGTAIKFALEIVNEYIADMTGTLGTETSLKYQEEEENNSDSVVAASGTRTAQTVLRAGVMNIYDLEETSQIDKQIGMYTNPNLATKDRLTGALPINISLQVVDEMIGLMTQLMIIFIALQTILLVIILIVVMTIIVDEATATILTMKSLGYKRVN
ncbi:hypothetical protein FQA39_LY12909 [Lamprigera yunnana]|nr:hypothetical protein FQA39_LY12909 [Lamprigera yunnana]